MEENEIIGYLEKVCKCKYIDKKCDNKECEAVFLCPFGLIAVITKGDKEVGSVTEVKGLRYVDKVDIR